MRKGLLSAMVATALLGGIAPAAHASLSWDVASHDFGNQEVGNASPVRTFTLTATCDAGAGLCTTPPAGAHSFGAVTAPSLDFGVESTTCTGTLTTPVFPSADSCTARVAFKPGSLGPKTGVLETATGPDVILSGTGVEEGVLTNAERKKCRKKKTKKKRRKCRRKKKRT